MGNSVLSKTKYHGKSTATIAQIRKNIVKNFIKESSRPAEKRYYTNVTRDLWSWSEIQKITCYTKPKGYKIKSDYYFIDENTKYGKNTRKAAKTLMIQLHDLGIPFSIRSRTKTFDQPYRIGNTITSDLKTMSIEFFLTYSQIDGIGDLI